MKENDSKGTEYPTEQGRQIYVGKKICNDILYKLSGPWGSFNGHLIRVSSSLSLIPSTCFPYIFLFLLSIFIIFYFSISVCPIIQHTFQDLSLSLSPRLKILSFSAPCENNFSKYFFYHSSLLFLSLSLLPISISLSLFVSFLPFSPSHPLSLSLSLSNFLWSLSFTILFLFSSTIFFIFSDRFVFSFFVYSMVELFRKLKLSFVISSSFYHTYTLY